ncbi:IS110 family transposase [Pseudoalteromonas sp. S1610]|uniref:IS110 family transposase n=1 Tax=unclassified Pseudoalteromonas TaxID=194690 RepID=UPI00110A2B76|nr:MULTISPECIES: IS110 family transposase [unclassified Pseudoalteromonas]MCK8125677.1 IS110 family transposase [Pseudoalteromonas sp. 2CM39R]TMP63792.1 IS110 family transposase [Pseudoalteromonas sp. S1610]
MNTKNNQNEINVGVDTGKKQLDIYIRPLDIYFTVENNQSGIKHAIQILKKHPVTCVTIEATGRLEQPFIIACAEANIPFVVANPVNIKRFAGAIGQKAKTDKLDAQLIAHFGEAIKTPLSSLMPEQMRLMSDLLSRRRQLMDMQTMEKNRSQIMPKTLSSLIKPILTTLENQIDKVDLKLQKLIEQCDEYKAKNAIIQSVPGVGNVVAFNLLSDMPELGYVNNKEAASLVGVASFNRENGVYQGKRMIRGGRPKIRTAIYIAMMSAIQYNSKFKDLYQRMVKAGKPKKVAIIACIRKLVVIINSMVKDGVMWDPKMV